MMGRAVWGIGITGGNCTVGIKPNSNYTVKSRIEGEIMGKMTFDLS
jgi:hypothetical protein